MDVLPAAAETNAAIAVRAAVHNLSNIRARRNRVVVGGKVSKEQWIQATTTARADIIKPKKSVRFETDENDCVKASVHEYELCQADMEAVHFSAKVQSALVFNAKLEGRRFYRLHRPTVATLERNHQECSAFHWAPDAREVDFFFQWSASTARGLERKVSRLRVFHEERAGHAAAVLRCQHENARRRMQQVSDDEKRTAAEDEALRQMSLEFSHRSRVFAYRMAAGDAAVARTLTVVESVVARSA